MTAAPSEKQVDYALRLANQLTGERARYLSQSSVLPKAIKSGVEASGLIDDLQAAIEAHEKWQKETGLTPGAKINRPYVKGDGSKVTASGAITGYRWSADLAAEKVVFVPDEAAVERGDFDPAKKWWLVVERLGDEITGDPETALEAERASLLARLAEIDAQLAALRP